MNEFAIDRPPSRSHLNDCAWFWFTIAVVLPVTAGAIVWVDANAKYSALDKQRAALDKQRSALQLEVHRQSMIMGTMEDEIERLREGRR